MKRLLLLSLLFLLGIQNIWAQQNLVGSYHISSGNPDDGGYNWFLFENNEFAMLTFGQIVSGKWKVNEHNQIDFTPYVPTESFQVFARYNSTTTGTKIMFNRLNINESLYFGTSKNEIQPVLNNEANCLPEPIIKTYKQPIENLILSNNLTENGKLNKLGLEFEMLNNNDFIVVYYNSHNKIAPFKGEISNDKLTMNYGEVSSAKRLISKIDEVEIKTYVEEQKNYYTQNSFLSTTEYRFTNAPVDGKFIYERSNFLVSDYSVDPATGTYKRKDPFDSEYQLEYNTLYLYKKLNFKATSESIKVNKKSVFTFGRE